MNKQAGQLLKATDEPSIRWLSAQRLCPSMGSMVKNRQSHENRQTRFLLAVMQPHHGAVPVLVFALHSYVLVIGLTVIEN